MIARYKNPDDDPRGVWLLSDLAARNYYAAGRYPITTPNGRVIDGPSAGSYWRVSKAILDGKDLPGYEALAGYVFFTVPFEIYQRAQK